ncbi:endo-1,4-beta-xylanase [Nocardiopsis sp. N85]|uniref:endo-1,4-beta-xylanase n=1 Tax=Nocardiopsis sp. N85 TaxID=3029400 RepID=UPI00237F4526|nr:endo-1,4-beta-xylanase [Nocardiopsis sp. N85]MDE3722242.1 endo-1,4-beta-xylanase [Nocardiopsis sp. N85]
MLLIAAALCTVILTVTGILITVLPGPPTQDGHRLPELARGHGIELGVAVAVNPLVNDRRYRNVIEDHYTSVTAENTMKWQHVQPERGEYDWSGPDTLVDFATARDLNVRGHTMLWHNQQPAWLSQGDWDADTLREVVHDHVTTVMDRYEGRVTSWDVINEPLEDHGPNMRENLWYDVLGPDYIAQTLYSAHAADPEARLYINEFGIERAGPKADALHALVTDLVDRGVPLHGVGFQGHFVHGNVPDDLADQMRRYTDLGLEVTISEVDVRIPEPVTAEDLAEQRREYHDILVACLEVDGCVNVTVWGVTDAHSWIPEWFPGYTAALPFDDSYRPKPALAGMVEALSRRPRPRTAATRA